MIVIDRMSAIFLSLVRTNLSTINSSELSQLTFDKACWMCSGWIDWSGPRSSAIFVMIALRAPLRFVRMSSYLKTLRSSISTSNCWTERFGHRPTWFQPATSQNQWSLNMMAFWQTVSDRSSAQVGQTLQGIAKIIGSIVLGQIQAQACFLHDSSVESDFALQEFVWFSMDLILNVS